MKKVINIAIVAFGGIAKSHILGAYMVNIKLNLPFYLRVSHIVTSRPEAVPFKDIKICSTLKEVFEDEEHVDIIDICNINQAHLESIKEAAQHNVAIYCEKPLADTLERASEAATIVRGKNILNGVPLIFRYLPCVHMLKEAVHNQRLGKIISFEACFYHNSYLHPSKRETWRTAAEAGGGASIDLGVHMLDISRFIFGEPKELHTCNHIHFPNIEADEVSHTQMVMEHDIRGESKVSRVYHQYHQKAQIEVFCEKGSFLCDFTHPYELQIHDFFHGTSIDFANSNASYMNYIVSSKGATQYHLDAHMAALADFAHKVYDGNSSGFGADFMEAVLSQSMLY